MMTERRRFRLFRVRREYGGDVLANEFARTVTGKLYFVKSITRGKDGEFYAVAWDVHRPGHNDILCVSLLTSIVP